MILDIIVVQTPQSIITWTY